MFVLSVIRGHYVLDKCNMNVDVTSSFSFRRLSDAMKEMEARANKKSLTRWTTVEKSERRIYRETFVRRGVTQVTDTLEIRIDEV